jgi:glycosyltransferase involved in cell wall biosynthesis
VASAIRRLADDPALRARMGASARARVIRDFDLMTNTRTIVDRVDQAGLAA